MWKLIYFLFIACAFDWRSTWASGPSGYCLSGPASEVGPALGSVRLVGDSLILTDSLSCPIKGPFWSNRTVDLTAGRNYTIIYTVDLCDRSNNKPVLSGAWLDANQDKKFDSSESLFPFSTLLGNQTHQFQVPLHSHSGGTGLRIQVQQENLSSTLNACLMFQDGTTIDYTVTILPSPQTALDSFFRRNEVWLLVIVVTVGSLCVAVPFVYFLHTKKLGQGDGYTRTNDVELEQSQTRPVLTTDLAFSSQTTDTEYQPPGLGTSGTVGAVNGGEV